MIEESLLSNINQGQCIKMFCENEVSLTSFKDFTINFVIVFRNTGSSLKGLGVMNVHL